MGVQLTQEMIDGARKTQEVYGVPAEITLAQIMLESAGSYEGGLSGLAVKAKNLFGIKAGSSWTGKTITLPTKEHTSSGTITVAGKFRAYSSYTDSIMDHGKLFQTERYSKNLKGVTDYKEYARGIQKSGYATDPNYANKLIGLIESNHLSDYAKGVKFGASSVTDTGGTSVQSGGNQAEVSGIAQHLMLGALVVVVVLFGCLFLIGAFDKHPVQHLKKKIAKKKVSA